MRKKNKKNPFKNYFIGTRVATTVFISVLVGHKLDQFFNLEHHIIMITLSAASILYSLYTLIKDVTEEK